MNSSDAMSADSAPHVPPGNDCRSGCIQVYRDVSALPVTSIPLREELRWHRCLFSYHDPRAFTTSVLPQPLFVFYRIVVFLYLLLWIIYDGIEQQQGTAYFIFFTTWGYILLLAGLLSTTVAAIVYMVTSHCRPDWVEEGLPLYTPLQPLGDHYWQDRTPWYLKVCWLLYTLGVTPSLPIVIIYWSCMGSYAEVSPESIHMHGLNLLLSLVDVLLSRVPLPLLHAHLLPLLVAVYTVFQAGFYAAGGSNPNDGGNYVYRFVDFGSDPLLALGLSAAFLAVGVATHLIFFAVARLRSLVASCSPPERVGTYSI